MQVLESFRLFYASAQRQLMTGASNLCNLVLLSLLHKNDQIH